MKRALVMGVNGTFGNAMAKVLQQDGWQVRALVREVSPQLKQQGYELVLGDVTNRVDVEQACGGVDLVVYGVNPANYDWANQALPWLDVTATVVEENGLTLLFPGNVYIYNPDHGPRFDEASRVDPVSPKGVIRQQMEERLKQASVRGAKVIILRMGDYIAANSKSSWLQVMVKRSRKGITLTLPGKTEHRHGWAYVPDAASAALQLIDRSDQLASFSQFHFAGYTMSFSELKRELEKLSGLSVKVKRFPWAMVYLMQWFSPLMKGLVEMRYLWQAELFLDDKRLRERLGEGYKTTPLSVALKMALFD